MEILAKRDKTDDRRPFYAFSENLDLPVIHIPIGQPVYRLDNARTRSRQIHYIKDRNKKKPTISLDFFRRGEEDVEAQRVQHGLLVELAKKGRTTGSIVPIWDVFAQEGKQTEELLVTSDGVIVNGNRRLAAMRELYKSGQYPSFENARVMVLPPTMTKDDILKIEVRLQVTPQTLLPYDWTDEALLIKDLRAAKVADDEITRMMRKEKFDDIQALLDRLGEAEIYLKEFLKAEEDYDQVIDREQDFIELQKALKNKKSNDVELARTVSHLLTKHAADATRRLYDYRIAFGENMPDVLEEYAKRKSISLDGQGTVEDPSDDDIFGAGEISAAAGRFKPVLAVLKNVDKTKENAALLREITDDVIDLNKDKNAGTLAIRKLRQANRTLDSIKVDKADKSTFGEMRGEIAKSRDALATIERQLK